MKKQILVVDDEPSILQLLKFILAKDYDVVLKSNGYDATLWLEEANCPDLILLDVEMPYFNGPEFLKSIRISGLFRDIPVVILSVTEDMDSLAQRTPYLVNKFIKKPFDPIYLRNVVKELLEENVHEKSL
ncbi:MULTISPECIES: response regulator [Olivibacter]|jgi:CheY-like chemotaxis protein|uniref:Response regulator n=1 Tax=Olivibacter oleidegradans TaxID=760123 RepID=A0ABV6HMS5_9SPHI|nr:MULTISPECIES: response regulator [Olivibacter]MDX3915423.1 response regulator [Pseudosphingobacterium sp.]QEL02932.1 response regulator [Olivibacter sp. LS-1]